jgi:hypothetical protein
MRLAGGILRRVAPVNACSWASLRLDERGSLEQAWRIFLRLRYINERQRE